MTTLIVFSGLPGVGKTTIARLLAGSRGLVEKHHAFSIEVELPLEPSLARLHHVRAGLLAGVKIPFCRTPATL